MQETNISAAEIARFNALAAGWWDPDGTMRPLHRMNPARINWITAHIAQRFPQPSGVRLLDVGCGAGLAAEALARRGYEVLGIDAAREPLAAAEAHARDAGLQLRYRLATVEMLLAERQRFAVVTALEVIEHVPDQRGFVRGLAALVQPGGLVFVSTLNRTVRSFIAAKLGAEYLLRWLPIGTHDWNKFATPAELSAWMGAAGLRVSDVAGLSADVLRGTWRIGRDLSVNYLLAAAS